MGKMNTGITPAAVHAVLKIKNKIISWLISGLLVILRFISKFNNFVAL